MSRPTTDSAASPESPEISRLRSEHASAVAALRAAIRDTTRLTRLFAVLSESAPVPQLLEKLLATVSELFVSDVVILLESGRGGSPRIIASIGLPLDETRRPMQLRDDSPVRLVQRTGAPVSFRSVRDEVRTDDFLRNLGAEAALWLPVAGDQSARDRVLVLARCQPLPYESADVDLLAAMAHRIGLILERADADRERLRLETRLHQAEKAQSLARMAGAIAHHFNNMLAAVSASLDLALDELAEGHPARIDIVRAKDAARRAAGTSTLMLAYLGQTGGAREVLDLGRWVREAAPVLQTTLPRSVRLRIEAPEPDGLVRACPPQLNQVLANLVANAAEAIGDEPGEITIALQTLPRDAIPTPQIAGEVVLSAPEYLCLSVNDTGPGMTSETLGMIFDPFFSTKEVGRGLGLPVALGTIRAHDGALTVDTQPGQGTTVRVFLPRVRRAQATAPAGPVPGAAAPIGGGGMVLLADDEEVIRFTTERVLRKLGYATVAAADGREAVDRFLRGPEQFRFAVLDLTMPHLDGWAALAALRSTRPDLPAIIVSGYEHATALGSRLLDQQTTFLHKPYDLDEFKAAIARILSAGRPSSPG